MFSWQKKTNTGCTLSSTHGCKAGKGSWPTSGKFLQKKGGKNIPFLDENIPYLEGSRGGGGTKSLNQKNRPQVVFKFLGPPCLQRSLYAQVVNVDLLKSDVLDEDAASTVSR